MSLDAGNIFFINEIHKRNSNLYKILGLQPTATPEEIKQAHKRLAFKLHPDRRDDELKQLQLKDARGESLTVDERTKLETANAKFSQLQNAFEILSDATKKSEYDRFYLRTKQAPARPAAPQASAPQPSAAVPPQTTPQGVGIYFPEIRPLSKHEVRLLLWLDFHDTLPKWGISAQQDEKLASRNILENAIKILGFTGKFYVSGDDVHFENKSDVAQFEAKLRDLPLRYMQFLATSMNNKLDYLGIKTTISTQRKTAEDDYPVMCCFSGTKHLLFGIMEELKEYKTAITLNKAQTVVTIDPNKLGDPVLEKLEGVAKKIRDYAMEEMAPGYKEKMRDIEQRIMQEDAAKPIGIEGKQPVSAIEGAQPPKPSAQPTEAPTKKPTFLGSLAKGLFGGGEKKDIHPDDESIVLYKTPDNMLAMEFSSTALRNKFIEMIGSAELSSYQKKICPTAVQHSDRCPIIKKRGNTETFPTTLFIPAVVSGQPPKQRLAVAVANDRQSLQLFTTIGGPYNQTIERQVQPSLFFLDKTLLEDDARVKISLSKILFKGPQM